MSAVVRRMGIWNTLCCRRQVKMKELAEKYGVTTRTIRYDIDCISLTHPIETVRGRFDGCVKLADWYVPNKSLLTESQIDFLVNLGKTMEGSDETILSGIINTLTAL